MLAMAICTPNLTHIPILLLTESSIGSSTSSTRTSSVSEFCGGSRYTVDGVLNTSLSIRTCSFGMSSGRSRLSLPSVSLIALPVSFSCYYMIQSLICLLDDDILMVLPELYKYGREGHWFSMKVFAIYMFDAVFQVSDIKPLYIHASNFVHSPRSYSSSFSMATSLRPLVPMGILLRNTSSQL